MDDLPSSAKKFSRWMRTLIECSQRSWSKCWCLKECRFVIASAVPRGIPLAAGAGTEGS